MIVVDLGAMPHGPEESVHKLANRFRPEIIWAFDPHPGFIEGIEKWGRTLVIRRRAAAALEDGVVEIVESGDSTTVMGGGAGLPEADTTVTVDAFNLPAFLWALPESAEVVLKADIEGGEHLLLDAIHEQRLDERLKLVLVEWHDGTDIDERFYDGALARKKRPVLRCPVEPW